MNGNPRVGIAIANFNNDRYIAQCLDSIVEQSYPEIQVMIVDDGSTDNSVEIISRYVDRHSGIKIIENERNRGVAFSRNLAIKHLDCDYITTLDSDDFYCHPDKTIAEIKRLSTVTDSSAAAFSDILNVSQSGKPKRRSPAAKPRREGNIFADMLTRACFIPRDFLFPRVLFDTVGGFDDTLPLYEDWDFKLRLARHLKFSYSGVTGIAYRHHADGLSAAAQQQHLVWQRKVFEKNLPETADAAALRRIFESNIQPAAYQRFLKLFSKWSG